MGPIDTALCQGCYRTGMSVCLGNELIRTHAISVGKTASETAEERAVVRHANMNTTRWATVRQTLHALMHMLHGSKLPGA